MFSGDGSYLLLVEGLGDRGVDVHHGVVVPLVDVEGEVAAGHHVDHFLDADVLDVLGLLLTHVSLDEGVHGEPPGPRLAGAGVCGLGRGGGGAVRLLLDGCGGGGGGRGGVGGGAGAGALVGAGVAADLDGALEVDLHAVRELEGLEVGVAEHRGAGSEVLDLVELGHELGPGDAALLVHQLDGRPLAVMRHAVADQHVELLLVVLDGEHHGHGLADLDEAGHLAGPGSLADLDLHPAANIVPGEVSPHHVQHVHGERPVVRRRC